MLVFDGRCFIPFGCSCINQFQLRMAMPGEAAPSGLLDWNITTPAASLRVLELHLQGVLLEALTDRAAYSLDPKAGFLVNSHLEGLYFWHEKGADILDAARPRQFNRFAKKLRHTARSMTTATGDIHLLWSNVQPNLKAAIEAGTDKTMTDFRLERPFYDAFQLRAQAVYPRCRFHFTTRAEDCCPSLYDQSDVLVVDLDRSADYQGPVGLYQPVLSRAFGMAMA